MFDGIFFLPEDKIDKIRIICRRTRRRDGGVKFGGLVPRKFDVLQGSKIFYVVGRVDFFAVENVFWVEKPFYRTHYPELRLRVL